MNADLAACEAILRGGSRSFWWASRLLPRRVRGPTAAVYAFCRVADDAVDEGADRATALAQQRTRLARVYAGRPAAVPMERALAEVVARHRIPRALPEALLEGFAWDLAGRRYRTLEDLFDYCARVAASVGAMMTLLMDRHDAEVLARACDLGVAMQLTNIARDVGEDARAGRIYLPLDWLEAAGVAPETWLATPAFTPAVGALVRRLLGVADALYARADRGIRCLPADCRPAIRAARLLYADIGRAIAAAGYDSVSERRVTATARKLWLALRATAAAAWRPRACAAPTLEAVRFLVEAAADGGPAPEAPAAASGSPAEEARR